MKKFTYSGPVASVTLNIGADTAQPGEPPRTIDLNFHPGAVTEAPELHPYIQRLVRKGFLTPLAEEGAAKGKKAEAA